jgi:hypothetical protein
MLTPSLLHIHFFHSNDTCYLGSTKFLESTIVFDSFLEGRSSSLVLGCYAHIEFACAIFAHNFNDRGVHASSEANGKRNLEN